MTECGHEGENFKSTKKLSGEHTHVIFMNERWHLVAAYDFFVLKKTYSKKKKNSHKQKVIYLLVRCCWADVDMMYIV